MRYCVRFPLVKIIALNVARTAKCWFVKKELQNARIKQECFWMKRIETDWKAQI